MTETPTDQNIDWNLIFKNIELTITKKPIKNWDEFITWLNTIINIVQGTKPFFRGHADSKWKLESTLDRIKKNCIFYEYIISTINAKAFIESFTKNYWRFKFNNEEIDYQINSGETEDDYKQFESYLLNNFKEDIFLEYLIYLRHHGFPSPFIDWTFSPYIAAFFAFKDVIETDTRALYFYIHKPSFLDFTESSYFPHIATIRSTITTHKRHHLQQSVYTYCLDKNPKLCFKSHEELLGAKELSNKYFFKILIENSAREEFLRRLNQMNINAFSLFDSEDGLMNKVANDEFVIDKFKY